MGTGFYGIPAVWGLGDEQTMQALQALDQQARGLGMRMLDFPAVHHERKQIRRIALGLSISHQSREEFCHCGV